VTVFPVGAIETILLPEDEVLLRLDVAAAIGLKAEECLDGGSPHSGTAPVHSVKNSVIYVTNFLIIVNRKTPGYFARGFIYIVIKGFSMFYYTKI